LQAVFPTAEVLPDAWREKIARVFSCKVLSYYGCGEVNSLGYQCGEADGFHRCDEHAVMEIALPQGGASFEGRGAFLITDLDNHAMPILRYANGDAGVLAAQPCPCGRIGGRILSLQGRVNDLLVTEDGACISGAIAPHALRLSRGVILYQFVQDRPGQVLVRIVRSAEYDRSSEEMRLRDILAKHLGASSEITFEYPDDIERSPAGKIRFVINRYLQTAPQGARTTGTGSGTQG
jgi:phenylacetate-CoA ligase